MLTRAPRSLVCSALFGGNSPAAPDVPVNQRPLIPGGGERECASLHATVWLVINCFRRLEHTPQQPGPCLMSAHYTQIYSVLARCLLRAGVCPTQHITSEVPPVEGFLYATSGKRCSAFAWVLYFYAPPGCCLLQRIEHPPPQKRPVQQVESL